MAIVNTREMFKKAYRGGYAIGAFNINNMEIIQAVVDAAAELSSPVILQVSSSALKYARPGYLLAMVRAAVEETGVDLALHLDHGPDFETCKMCVDSGFSSVMIDASHLPFEQNAELTAKVVEYAHNYDVTVEAELGRLAGIEDEVNVSSEHAFYTDPADAVKFVELSGCDSLAIAIGTSHGAYKFAGKAELRMDILREIQRLMPEYPIVLHGASSVDPKVIETINAYGGNMKSAAGVPEQILREAASLAV
ncbi:MAG: ketose-bisphosphate aldolase, partial [Clostridia bacterium]|nr:ketose-bisphosphate aldolase [Clostridia bacterium]